MKKKVRVVVSDLDGTLLDHTHKIGRYTQATIQKLVNTGVQFWIATGRHHVDALAVKKVLGTDGYLFASNGGTVVDAQGKIVHQATIPEEIVRQILEIEVPDSVYRNLYQGDLWLMEREDLIFKGYYDEGDFQPTYCKFETRLDQLTSKVFFTALDTKALERLAQAISTQFGTWVDITFSMPECLEIMPKGVNKGVSIEKLLKELGIHPDEAIIFGDGLNDLEMLQMAGRGYLMQNANPKLKALLPELDVVGSNAEEAVAGTLEKIFKI